MASDAGTAAEPVRVLNFAMDLGPHDGALPPIVGVETSQVLRANRRHPAYAENFGWTYNNAPMMAYWNGRFYVEYFSNTYGEFVPPGHTLISTSADGRAWDIPKEVFPIYYLDVPPFRNKTGDAGMAFMYQRMGFYVAPNGRLLVLAWYGTEPNPFGPGGIGRVVREAYKDGTYGPIYFLRYNEHYDPALSARSSRALVDPKDPGWNEGNTPFPFYTRSRDAGFLDAVKALMADRLKTMQWWEEDADPAAHALKPALEAPTFYHRRDGTAVIVAKWSVAMLSSDEGRTFTPPVRIPSIITAGAKVWGQRTADGRYALVYNPDPADDGYHRYPLALAAGDDGIAFDRLLLIDGEVSPRRYMGRSKDFGPQYPRGILEGNGTPPGSNLWVTYDMNKEDIWVSRVPVPIRYRVTGPVSDHFDGLQAGGEVPDWNIRRGKWAPVDVVDFPSARNKSLRLADRDPYEYARAERVFAEGASKILSLRLYPHQTGAGRLDVEVLDPSGHRPVRIVFGPDGRVRIANGSASVDAGAYTAGAWHNLKIAVDAAQGTFDVALDGKTAARGASFAEPASSVSRLLFRTGAFLTMPTREGLVKSRDFGGRDLPDSEDPVPEAVFNIDDVIIN
jgi:hypothetical protein